MANRISTKTTYDLKRVIQPFHTGGNVALEHEGKVLATSVGEEVVLSGLLDGEEFARLEGVSLRFANFVQTVQGLM